MMTSSELAAHLTDHPGYDVIVDVGGVLIDVVGVDDRPDREHLVLRLEPEDVQWVLEYAERHGLAALRRRAARSSG